MKTTFFNQVDSLYKKRYDYEFTDPSYISQTALSFKQGWSL